MKEQQNIFPTFDKFMRRENKEKLLHQKAKVVWLTGLSGSGKTTIAIKLEKELVKNGFFCHVLDGDNVRSGINKNLGFSEDDRIENIRRVAEVSKLFLNSGIITINSFVSPTKAIREVAKQIIGDADFIEVFIDTPMKICEERDVKGLYKKARLGEIKNFTGIDVPYESPINPVCKIETHKKTIANCVDELLSSILPLITY